jgi:V8-like Glu-specific endopeptidase
VRLARLILLIAAAGLLALPPVASADHLPFTTTLQDPLAPANRMVGRLSVKREDGTTQQCTAAVIDASNRSTVLTAAHCLLSPSHGGALSVLFRPGYHDGQAPLGTWPSSRQLLAVNWPVTFSNNFDYAFLLIDPNSSGIPIQTAVGALPIAFNQPRNQAYRIVGLPGMPNPPFDGQKLYACDTAYGEDAGLSEPGPPQMVVGCDMGGGASGSPWINPQGVVASVLSDDLAPHHHIRSGPYLDQDAAALFEQASPTEPPLQLRKCKKANKHKHPAAAKKKKKKKCKKKKKKRGR